MRNRDPGWRQFGSGIRDGKKSDTGSGINIPDPQHCSDTVESEGREMKQCGIQYIEEKNKKDPPVKKRFLSQVSIIG